jgi:hypothetical protein
MDIKVYLNAANNEISHTTHFEVMKYDINDHKKELNIVFKTGVKLDISLETVNRILVVKPFCIYHKDQGNLITKKQLGGDYTKHPNRDRNHHV